MKPQFTSLLLKWNREKNTRSMPWKGEKDPYKIWLSEIILQQTRVEQGLQYYEKFILSFPSVQSLAGAKDEKVFKLWEGLGYYSRCRNLLAAARYIVNECGGVFPSTYETIRQLKGVGPYTAAAISSFAFNEAHAVVDGNVFRVLARVFGIATPIDSQAGKKQFSEKAQELLDKNQPGIYNQAIMDFGAVVCKPASPLCGQCPMKKICTAFAQDKTDALPVKEKKLKSRTRWFYYLVMEQSGKVLVKQRNEKDIWQGLYEFILIEMPGESSVKQVLEEAGRQYKWWKKTKPAVLSVSPLYKQQLSHQLITGQFIRTACIDKPEMPPDFSWVSVKKINALAFPKFMHQFLENPSATGIPF